MGSREFTLPALAGDEHFNGLEGSPRKKKPFQTYQSQEITPGSGVLQAQVAGGQEVAWEKTP